jgi:hypothetical protein
LISFTKMATTFRQFLTEGGAATSKFNTERANKADIEKALQIVSKTLGLSDIQDRVLGSVHLTLSGHKQDSGDIDIAVSSDELSPEEANEKMLALTNGEGNLNKGSNVGSYAVDVGGKKVQVDLMFVTSKEWAKFIYHSGEGHTSNYPGVVRNILLSAVARHTHEAGKDFLIKVDSEVVARASRAVKLDTGLERLFKMAKRKKDGTFSKTMDKVDPAELKVHAEKLAGKEIKFSHDPEIVNDPDQVAAFLFGPDVKAKDIMTAEQVIGQIKKLKNANEILDDAKRTLKGGQLPIPKEIGS